jgi:hypothetical protein
MAKRLHYVNFENRIMKRKFAAVFALYGYLVALWFYAYPLHTSGAIVPILSRSCVTCVHVTRLGGPPWPGVLLFLAPSNSLLYALLGFAIGWAVLITKRCFS